MARKTWVLDTETKGTGANVVPLEKVLEKPEPKRAAPPPRPRQATEKPKPPRSRARPAGAGEDHRVRSRRATCARRPRASSGRVQELDPKAGTATVFWLKQGRASTVPLSAISRR